MGRSLRHLPLLLLFCCTLASFALAAPPPRAPASQRLLLATRRPPLTPLANSAAPSREPGLSAITPCAGDGAGGFYFLIGSGFGGAYFSAASTAGQNVVILENRLFHIGADGNTASGWPSDGVALETAPENQDNAVLTVDGVGGVIVAWGDLTSFDELVRAQRFNASGARLWAPEGVLLGSGFGLRDVAEIAPDGSGGALVVWTHDTLDSLARDTNIYLQRVTAGGTIASGWDVNGVPVCAESGVQFNPHIVADGTGAAVVSWYDERSFTTDVYAQRVSGTGTPLWTTGGVPLGILSGVAYAMTSDGAGGAIFSFERLGDNYSMDIFALHVDAAGTTPWGASGVSICAADGNQHLPMLAPDGAGGAFIAWRGAQYGASRPDLFAQHVMGNGLIAPGWTTNGIFVAGSVSYYAVPFVAPDGAGGAFVAWDSPDTVIGTGGSRSRIYAQRFTSAGALASGWTFGGKEFTGDSSLATYYGVLLGPSAGLVAIWGDARNTGAGPGYYAQRLNSSGVKQWADSGVPIMPYASSIDVQGSPALVSRGAGAVQVAWARFSGHSLPRLELTQLDNSGAPVGSVAEISSSSSLFSPPAIADGEGGAFLCWTAFGSGGQELRVQRVDGAGVELWTPGGVSVPDFVDASGGSFPIGAVADGKGGVIFAGAPYSTGGVRLQRLDAAGVERWPGVVDVGSAFGGHASVVSDGESGAIVIWEAQVYDMGWHLNLLAQHVDSTGTVLWDPSGVLLAAGRREELFPRATTDGAGGAIVTWMGDDLWINTDIWAQRVSANGTIAPGWPADGVRVCGAQQRQGFPDIATDEAGGAFIAWWDGRSGTVQTYAQHLDAGGVAQWADDGIRAAGGAGPEYPQTIEPDGTGGVHLSWLDGGASSWDVFAQRLDAAGARQWGANGLALCTDPGFQYGAVMLAGGAGGAFVAWEDRRAEPGQQVFVQKIGPTGVLGWPGDGITGVLATLEHADAEPGLVRLTWAGDGSFARATLERASTDGDWRAIATLDADGSGRLHYEDRDVTAGARYGYRLRITSGGTSETLAETWIDVPLAMALALEGARPNPVVGELVVSFTTPLPATAKIEVLDITGRRVASRTLRAPAGRTLVNLGATAPPGVYLLRLTMGGRTFTGRFVRMR